MATGGYNYKDETVHKLWNAITWLWEVGVALHFMMARSAIQAMKHPFQVVAWLLSDQSEIKDYL